MQRSPVPKWALFVAGALGSAVLGTVGMAAAQSTETPSTTTSPDGVAASGDPASTPSDATVDPTNDSNAATPAPNATTDTPADDPAGGRGPHGRCHGTPLTGDTAAKVTAAAQQAVPGGTVDRVEGDRSGTGYEAHVTKVDGSRVVVKIDPSFAVTSVAADQHAGHGPGDGDGPHGPRDGNGPHGPGGRPDDGDADDAGQPQPAATATA